MPPGTRIGSFEIVGALGAGGMGEVYRATDTNLKREVAIKVLPQAVAEDGERLARFQREAELLAALNHPNIAHVFGQDRSPGITALVMELVEGPTLADRIREVQRTSSCLPVTEALTIAKQIAEALVAAHEKGIIHRDLKPANIKVRPDGTVKVLDFGLAKAMEVPGQSSGIEATSSPTITDHATQAGMILGTAAYMSPEQASGKPTDRRTDLWSFGVVLYEMLTARQMFEGETGWHVRAAVLTQPPDWTALPPDTPSAIRRLLRRSVEKDRRLRLSDAGDAVLEIADALSGTDEAPALPAAVPSPRRRVLPLAFALTAGAVLASLATWTLTRSAVPEVSRFAIVPPDPLALAIQGGDRDIAISPDGAYIAYRAGSGRGQLAVRRQDQIDATVLPGIMPARAPFFSPDGQWIGFFDLGELKKVATTGGPSDTITTFTAAARGASWVDEHTIIVATADPATGLLSVPVNGGEPTVLTRADAAQLEGDHLFPSVLPGGRAVLFTITARPIENSQVAVLDLTSGRRKTLIRGGSQAEYVSTGHLVFASKGRLEAVRFDLSRLEVVGEPVTMLDEVMMSSLSGAANFAVSQTGTLVYVPGSGDRQEASRHLVWVDRQGRQEPIAAPPRPYTIPRLAPDGRRIAFDSRDQEFDLWTWDLARKTTTRATFDPGLDIQPAWSSDGRRLIFSSARAGASNLYWRAADGSGEDHRLTTSANPQVATAATPDGVYVIGSEVFPKTGNDVMQFKWSGAPSEPLVQTPFQEYNAELAPGGRFLAYQSNESGQFEIYVRPYPRVTDGRWQVSSSGGVMPAWSPDGGELFFVDNTDALISVPVQTTGPTFSAGEPTKVFDTKFAMPTTARTYDVSRDGQRFLTIQNRTAGDTATPASIAVVLNWFVELKRLLPSP